MTMLIATHEMGFRRGDNRQPGCCFPRGRAQIVRGRRPPAQPCSSQPSGEPYPGVSLPAASFDAGRLATERVFGCGAF